MTTTAATTPTLQAQHKYYCTKISSPKMAISLELARFLLTLDLEGKKVLELGSGFSSKVLRDAGASVTTVDTDPSWLQKTMEYCGTERGFHLWDEIYPSHAEVYDIILQDIGGMERRAKTLPWVWAHLRWHGILVLDDVHKKPYHDVVVGWLKGVSYSLPYDGVAQKTRDRFKRYAFAIRKED